MDGDHGSCSTCRFWDCTNPVDRTKADLFAPASYECRRRGPQVAWHGGIEDPDEVDASPFVGVWPSTFAHDWCGEHEPLSEDASETGKS